VRIYFKKKKQKQNACYKIIVCNVIFNVLLIENLKCKSKLDILPKYFRAFKRRQITLSCNIEWFPIYFFEKKNKTWLKNAKILNLLLFQCIFQSNFFFLYMRGILIFFNCFFKYFFLLFFILLMSLFLFFYSLKNEWFNLAMLFKFCFLLYFHDRYFPLILD